ncbi:hypothetical protein GCM10008957_53060 [Deinococcus ruber]|uniref:Uncharacterized protein n=2 Tax=Deinococcus ruber TaxID=1848197 RepID=A0A918FGU9_9DEIO|nr:hypothetical protein GCM10008957_53060 [Deinococcus ruber]
MQPECDGQQSAQMAQAQAEYLVALAAYTLEQDARTERRVPIYAARAAGTMTKEESHAALDALDDGDPEVYWQAWSNKCDAQQRLLDWGQAELRRAWTQHGQHLPGVQLEDLEMLFNSYSVAVRDRLIELCLKMKSPS